MDELKAQGRIIDAQRLAGPMVSFGTYRQITDTALLDNGTNVLVTGVDIPMKTFLVAVIDQGLMSKDEVNNWIDKNNQEWEKEQIKEIINGQNNND